VGHLWRRLLAALRRSSPLAREITLILLVKTALLYLLFQALSHGPKPGRSVAQERTAQQLLGAPARLKENADER
jgi:hypothetical protein